MVLLSRAAAGDAGRAVATLRGTGADANARGLLTLALNGVHTTATLRVAGFSSAGPRAVQLSGRPLARSWPIRRWMT